MKFLSSGMVLVPPILVTWWKKMMWLAFRVFPMKTVSFVIWAGLAMSQSEVQMGTANYTREKRDYLEAWAGKAVYLVPTNMIFFSSGMVLVPPSFLTWWKNMTWLAFGVFPMKTVSCFLRLFARQVSRSTVGAKS